MRKSATEIINELEDRIAKLEGKKAIAVVTLDGIEDHLRKALVATNRLGKRQSVEETLEYLKEEVVLTADLISGYLRQRRSANIKRQAGLIQSTGLEMVSMIEDQYREYGLDENEIEVEAEKWSRTTGSTLMLVSLRGYYGIVRVDGRREDVEVVSDDYSYISRMYQKNLG